MTGSWQKFSYAVIIIRLTSWCRTNKTIPIVGGTASLNLCGNTKSLCDLSVVFSLHLQLLTSLGKKAEIFMRLAFFGFAIIVCVFALTKDLDSVVFGFANLTFQSKAYFVQNQFLNDFWKWNWEFTRGNEQSEEKNLSLHPASFQLWNCQSVI